MNKTLLSLSLLLGLSLKCVDAQVVYSNDFSASPTFVEHAVGGDFQIGGGSDAITQTVSGSFSWNTSRYTSLSVSGGELVFDVNTQGVAWLLLDTSAWVPGDYTLTFDVTSSDGRQVNWDIFGGSGLDAFDGTSDGDYLEVRTASNVPQVAVRNLIGGAAAEALDSARTVLDSASDNTFTAAGEQSISFTLTDAHVGTAGDYFLVGWTSTSAADWTMDDLTVTLVGSSLPEVSVSVEDAAAAEASSDTGTIRISRTGATTDALSVNYTLGGTASAGDYSETHSGTATITAGNSFVDLVFTPVDDSDQEGDETIQLDLMADAAYSLGSPSTSTVTIADNDVPVVSVSVTDAAAAEEGSDTGTIRISRDITTGDLDVNYTLGGTASTGDYSETYSGTVTITNGLSYVDLDFTPVDDSVYEGDETIQLDLALGSGYSLGTPSSGTVTISENDPVPPTLTVAVPDAAAAETGSDPGTIRITRDSSSGNLVVNYTLGGTASSGDYSETDSGTATIPDGFSSVDLTYTPVDDADLEGSETVQLSLSADAAYLIGSPSVGTVTIADNETPPVVPTIDSFTTSDSLVTAGSSVTLTWATSDALTISIDNGVGDVTSLSTDGDGNTTVVVNEPTLFTLTATNENGYVVAFQHVQVGTGASAPNIIFFLADDQGWVEHSVSQFSDGNQSDLYQTPHLQRLADEGVSFTWSYSNPNCAPTRAALMTGQYAGRTGNMLYNVNGLNRGGTRTQYTDAAQQTGVDDSSVLIGKALRDAGYISAHFGKFHIGHDPVADHGYNYNYGGGPVGNPGIYFTTDDGSGPKYGNAIPENMDAYAADYTQQYVDDILWPVANGNDPDTVVGTPKHLTDAVGDAVIEFMDNHRSGPDAAKPFYAQVHFFAPHTPIQPRPDLQAKYDLLSGTTHGTGFRDDAAMVETMDQNIGRILNYLDDPNGDGDTSDSIANNTVVFFASDNGEIDEDSSSLLGKKGMHYEGGIRVATCVRMPGTIPANKVSTSMLYMIDFYPTMLDFAEAAYPNATTHPLDGESFYNHLLDPDNNPRDRSPIFYHFPGYMDSRAYASSAVIAEIGGKRYKYIYAYDPFYIPGSAQTKGYDQYQLYNLTDDVAETVNLMDYIDLAMRSDPEPDDPNDDREPWDYQIYKDIANTMAGYLSEWLAGAPGDATWTPLQVTYNSNYPDLDPGLIGTQVPFAPASLPDIEIPEADRFEVLSSDFSDPLNPSFEFRTEPNYRFQVQCRESLTTGDWVDLGTALEADASTETLAPSDPSASGAAERFYRVNLLPQ